MVSRQISKQSSGRSALSLSRRPARLPNCESSLSFFKLAPADPDLAMQAAGGNGDGPGALSTLLVRELAPAVQHPGTALLPLLPRSPSCALADVFDVFLRRTSAWERSTSLRSSRNVRYGWCVG